MNHIFASKRVKTGSTWAYRSKCVTIAARMFKMVTMDHKRSKIPKVSTMGPSRSKLGTVAKHGTRESYGVSKRFIMGQNAVKMGPIGCRLSDLAGPGRFPNYPNGLKAQKSNSRLLATENDFFVLPSTSPAMIIISIIVLIIITIKSPSALQYPASLATSNAFVQIMASAMTVPGPLPRP